MSASSVRRPSGVQVLAGGLSIVMKAVWPSMRFWIMSSAEVLQDDAGEVLLAVAFARVHLVDLLRQGAEHHGMLRGLRGLGNQRQVLEHQVGAEAAGELARAGKVLQNAGVGVVGIGA